MNLFVTIQYIGVHKQFLKIIFYSLKKVMNVFSSKFQRIMVYRGKDHVQ